MLCAVDHHRHRLLRSNMNPFFSMTRIRRLEPAIQALADKLCSRLSAFKNTGKSIVIRDAFLCYATDVISSYVLGEEPHYLDGPDFLPQWSDTISGTLDLAVNFRHFPSMIRLIQSLPERWVMKLDPGIGLLFQYQHQCLKKINSIIASQADGSKSQRLSKGDDGDPSDKPTFLHDVLQSKLPPKEKSPKRLAHEVRVLVAAGGEATTNALTNITFYLLANLDKLKKLQEELETLDPDHTATLVQFDQMPYLASVLSCDDVNDIYDG
ncbi:hypothetical protein VTN96DRAFT_9880 [Rasamsonia emersonii]